MILTLIIAVILIVLIYKHTPKFDLARGGYGYRLYLWYTNDEGKRTYKILYPFYLNKK